MKQKAETRADAMVTMHVNCAARTNIRADIASVGDRLTTCFRLDKFNPSRQPITNNAKEKTMYSQHFIKVGLVNCRTVYVNRQDKSELDAIRKSIADTGTFNGYMVKECSEVKSLRN